jgi:hypothetical protein
MHVYNTLKPVPDFLGIGTSDPIRESPGMLVLHAALVEGSLALWGEAPVEDTPARRGRKPRTKGPEWNPYAVKLQPLIEALKQAGVKPAADGDHLFAWLPATAIGPLPSSPLIAAPVAAETPTTLTPFLVSALLLTASEAVNLLAACLGR